MISRPQLTLALYSDEGGSGAGIFLSEFGDGTTLQQADSQPQGISPILFRLSDSTGTVTFQAVEPAAQSSLHSSDAFLLDVSSDFSNPAIYVWIGNGASLKERRLAPQYAQKYLYNKKAQQNGNVQVAIPIIKINEGRETEPFLQAVGARG